MWQPLFVQSTTQLPVQTTAQSLTEVQLTSLFGPTSAEHCLVSWQSRWQLSPQMTPQLSVFEHCNPQPEPHDCEHCRTSWHRELQPSSQTVPQRFMLWHDWSQSSPSQPRKHSSPSEHSQCCPDEQLSPELQPITHKE